MMRELLKHSSRASWSCFSAAVLDPDGLQSTEAAEILISFNDETGSKKRACSSLGESLIVPCYVLLTR